MKGRAMKRYSLLLAAALASALLVQSTALQADQYDLLLLEPPGFDIHRVLAGDIDEFGNVVGWFEEVGGAIHGFYYDRQLNYYHVTENDLIVGHINSLGEMVGTHWGEYLGYYWSAPSAEPIPLLPLSGHVSTGATGGINAGGLIAGASSGIGDDDGAGKQVSPVVWIVTESGASDPIQLPLLPGHIRGVPRAISPPNASGVSVIVGSSGSIVNGQGMFAVSWKVKLKSNGTLILKEGPVALGSLAEGEDQANGVNRSFYVVGESGYQAFKKSKNGSIQALKPLEIDGATSVSGNAWDINSHKDIVGSQNHLWGDVSRKLSGYRAVLWVGGRSVVNLDDQVTLGRGDRITSAHAINDAGEIVVSVDFKNLSGSRAGILIPID